MAKNETKSGAAKAADETQVEETTVEETTVTPESVTKELNTETTEKAGVGDEIVEVSKSDLQAFMRRMDELEASNKKLLAVADKGRMFSLNEQERKDKTEIPQVKVTRIGSPTGPLVIAWQMTKNESYVDGNRLIEHQEIEVFFQDGSSQKMPLLEFYRQQNKDTVGYIKARTKNEDGSETLRLELKDGSPLEISLKFVN